MLRLCFVPQQQRGCVLPPLFLARLTDTPQQVPADAMWQIVLEAGSPATLSVMLFAMRYAFESVRHGLARRRTPP